MVKPIVSALFKTVETELKGPNVRWRATVFAVKLGALFFAVRGSYKFYKEYYVYNQAEAQCAELLRKR